MKQQNEQQHERLARIEKWAGMAMQGILTDRNLGSFGEVAQWSFSYAEAMEAEYQKRYVNKEDTA